MILNLMLGKKRGGLEQAALDYAEALAAAAIPALTVISPQAWVEAPLVAASVPHQSLKNFARWDPLAAYRLRRLAAQTNARAIICHGNRALGLALKALKGRVPIIAVAHNYSNRRFAQADFCFAITQHLATHLQSLGIPPTQIAQMPNMVRLREPAPRTAFRAQPVIGAMGRFVAKKGFTDYIEALTILHARGIPFRAILGGDGPMRPTLEAMIAERGLQNHVTLPGWVADKNAFFDNLDLFILPSLHEPFGIVLIEAMAYGLSVISTDAEGPSEIVHHDRDAILTPRSDPAALADAIAHMMQHESHALQLGEAGATLVRTQYSLAAMASRLQTALAPYITPHD